MEYQCKHNGSTTYKGKRIQYKKGSNKVVDGALDHVGSCKVVKAVVEESYPAYKGGGYYVLSNGEKVQGKEEAIKAEQNL